MKTLWICFVLLMTLAKADDVNVSATVDRKQVGVGDVINYTISISAGNSTSVEEPQLPPMDGFELINTSSGVETRSSFVNGRFITEQSRNFTYLLATNKKGELQIPAINVQVDGKNYKTQAIAIAVSGDRKVQPPPRGQQAPDPFDQLDDMEELFNQMLQRRFRGNPPGGQGNVQPPANPDESFFIDVTTDKTKAFVGEQIVANFYLYTRGQIRDIDTLKYPDLKGFWKEDLEMATRLNFEQVSVQGVLYQRALLVSYALFPIKAGKVTVDSYKAKCTVVTPSNFGFGRPYVFTKASKPVEVDVVEPPAEGRPANFTGAVGHFRLTAQFEPPTGATGQPVTLRVRVEGQGNAKLIELPKLELPSSFEIYDQKNNAKYLKDGSSFKEFEVMIIPRQPGVFDIPPIQIATFDPQAKKYTMVGSQPLRITVTGAGTAAAQPAAPGTTAPGASPTASPSEPLLPSLATELNEGSLASTTAPAFTVLFYLAVFGFLTQQGWTQFRRKPKKVNLNAILRRRLSRVREFAGKKEWRLTGVEMTNAIYYILGQLSDQGGASTDVDRLLENTPPSLRNELAVPIKDLLGQCEALSFAPEKMIGELTEKSRMAKLIEQLEKVLLRAIELSEI